MTIVDLSTARRRVVGPGEEAPSDDFYANKADGADARLALNKTALREAERKFKGAKYMEHLNEILDFSSPATVAAHPEIKLVGHVSDEQGLLRKGAPMYEIEGVPGFKFVAGALSADQQYCWLEQSFRHFMHHPNLSNLDTHYVLPNSGLFDQPEGSVKAVHKETGEEVANTKELFRKIRWTTLGYQYDWTSKTYDFDKDPVPFPPNLANLSKVIVKELFGPELEYKPEAGIVNYYQLGDTLTSHVDRSELNMEAPLLSLSLGCSAIFLVGGRGRDDPVRAMFLRSGDITILSGDCRHHFHGIPRILKESPEHLRSPLGDPVIEAIQNARININIRQVTL